MLQRQADSQPDGKPDWYLERTALNETHNQIPNCRHSAILLCIQRLNYTESAISLSRMVWFEFTVRINVTLKFLFGLWLFTFWLVINYKENTMGALLCTFVKGKPQDRDVLPLFMWVLRWILVITNDKKEQQLRVFIHTVGRKALPECSFHFIN